MIIIIVLYTKCTLYILYKCIPEYTKDNIFNILYCNDNNTVFLTLISEVKTLLVVFVRR